MLRAGGWHAACSVYGETFRYLLFERGWRPEAAEDFLEQLVKCVAMGYKEEEYFAWISEALAEHQLSLTKAMRKVFRKFRNELPSAALKGYTWVNMRKTERTGIISCRCLRKNNRFNNLSGRKLQICNY